MGYEVKTPVFEGPLDLLLHLITSHQVAITELSLTEIVNEYLHYLDVVRETALDDTSEFLLIAATLIQLKARYLLPGDEAVDLDEELALAEERDRLLARLLACLTFKDVAAVLAHRLEANRRFVPRLAGLTTEIRSRPPPVRLSITPEGLCAVAWRVSARRAAEPDLDHLDLDLPSVDAAIADLRQRVAETVETDFEALVAHCPRPIDVVAYFLALLELARWGVLSVDQPDRRSSILVRHNPSPPESDIDSFGGSSEWSRQ